MARTLQLDIGVFKDFISVPGRKAPETTSPLGSVIRARRQALRLSIGDLADALGTSLQVVSLIERGTISLSESDRWFAGIASVLGLDAEYLRGLRPERKKNKLKSRKKADIPQGSLADFIYKRRLELHITQKAAAERTGVKAHVIFLLENGRIPKGLCGNAEFWNRLAETLACEIPQALIPRAVPAPAPPMKNEIADRDPAAEDAHRIKELAGIERDDAERKGIHLLRLLLERKKNGFSLFFAKEGDLVELELLL